MAARLRAARPGQLALAVEPAPRPVHGIDERQRPGQEAQGLADVVDGVGQDGGIQRVADDGDAEGRQVQAQLMRPSRAGRQPVASESATHLDQLDRGLGVGWRVRDLAGRQDTPVLDDVAVQRERQGQIRAERGDGLVGLDRDPLLEHPLVGRTPASLGREDEHPGGQSVEPVSGSELG